ncbi:MAG: ABC transporter substrate-binding protein [Rhodospirillales bacterium]|nr:ABC transporter substrate-binding protein [Rhodospirillales bacterium]
MRPRLTRRAAMLGALAAPALTRLARAEAAPILLGSLTPQTGAGGSYGPAMVKSIRAVIDAVNGAGGVLGRKIELVSEDDETNPDAGVRAARKLIDVNKVPAILGTWASSVTTAVAPLCWQSRTMLFTVSGADSITQMPHQGYIIRTQPNTHLQMARFAEFMASQGAKRVYFLAAQTPFTIDSYNRAGEVLKAHGAATIGQSVYDASKTSFRSEVDAAIKAKPDAIMLNGYTPDSIVLLRELFQAGYTGRKYALAYAANAKLLASLPAAVTDGLVAMAPSPDIGSDAYKAVQAIVGPDPDPYSCQTYDHASLAILAMAQAKAATGLAIHDAVRKVGDPAGTKVTSAVSGLKLLAAGHAVNYEGASGPCKFTPTGDIVNCKFRFDAAEKGKYKLLSIS